MGRGKGEGGVSPKGKQRDLEVFCMFIDLDRFTFFNTFMFFVILRFLLFYNFTF